MFCVLTQSNPDIITEALPKANLVRALTLAYVLALCADFVCVPWLLAWGGGDLDQEVLSARLRYPDSCSTANGKGWLPFHLAVTANMPSVIMEVLLP